MEFKQALRLLGHRANHDLVAAALKQILVEQFIDSVSVSEAREAFLRQQPTILYGYIRSTKRTQELIPALRSADGKVEIDDQVKASLLSDFFQSVFTREPSAIFAHPSIRQSTSPPSTLPHPIPSLPSLTEEPLFTSTIVRAELLRLKPAKSPGPDRIPALALRELANELRKPLSAIFQKSFEDAEELISGVGTR
nr:unnamed protein product [Spirometra erinaceieuropaei]